MKSTQNYPWKWLALSTFPVILLILAVSLPARVEATGEQAVSWPSVTLDEVATGFSSPVHLTHAGDGTGRIFVVERDGRIKIMGGGTFLDISGIVQGGGEEGLLSVAFSPDYTNNRNFYVYFTDERPGNTGNNVLARFQVDPDNANLADPESEEILLIFPHPNQVNHNGGQIAFGPDGYLYIGTGDGGGSGDPYENAQDLDSLLGKILRIDVEGVSVASDPVPTPGPYSLYLPLIMKSDGLPYLIPPDNPYQSDPDALDEIWAYGLRNPWRFSFDRTTGDMWIGDVGQGTWEEIDHQPSTSLGGENYGWDCREGAHTYNDTQPPGGNDDCPGKTFVEPVFEYAHTLGCSVTGGYVYRGAIPGLDGIYIFADYCSGRVWGLQQDEGTWVSQELTNGGFGLASFGEDEAGELFVTRLDGTIFQLVAAAP